MQIRTAYVTLLSTADDMKTEFETIFQPADLTRQQYNVLRILRGAEPEGLPTLTIGERMIVRTPGITRMIDRMEGKGLVERLLNPKDRRFVICRIKKRGLDILDAFQDLVDETNESAFANLDDEELEQFIYLLIKLSKREQIEEKENGK